PRSAGERARAELAGARELAALAGDEARRLDRLREDVVARCRGAVAVRDRAGAPPRGRHRALDAGGVALEGRVNIAEDALVLRSDVILVPIGDLAPEVRATFTFDEGDYALTRRHGRMPS